MNQDFRLVSLFGDNSCSIFLDKFSDRKPRMFQCLAELEEVAVQLDSMNKGAKISSVVGSSVGAIGGVLSIVGLALSPVTGGVSLGLTMAGVGLSVTSGVNGAVTAVKEVSVNRTQQKKANEVFQGFMEDVQSLQTCLEEVSTQRLDKLDASPASDVKSLKPEDVVASTAKVVTQGGKALSSVPKVAADLPDIGQAALKGSLALSKSARAGLIGLNALFLGMDVFFICKDGISLSKGIETEVSQFFRARATLWRSEIDSWKNIHDSLNNGLTTAEENKIILETQFYPEPGMEKKKEKMEMPPEEVVENIEKAEKSCVIQ